MQLCTPLETVSSIAHTLSFHFSNVVLLDLVERLCDPHLAWKSQHSLGIRVVSEKQPSMYPQKGSGTVRQGAGRWIPL